MSTAEEKGLSIFLVGPGRLGCSLAQALEASRACSIVGVACHDTEDRERAARWMPTVPRTSVQEMVGVERVDLVLLTVRDDVIGDVAEVAAAKVGPSQVVAHTSGLLDVGVFASYDFSAAVGSFHPLQSFVHPETGAQRFRGCVVALEGDPRAIEVGHRLANELGSHPVVLTGDKVAYHAAAVVASNYLVALTSFATRLCAVAGIEEQMAVEMLRPLQLGALDNLSDGGPSVALTGPIARGDLDTVRAHLDLIGHTMPELRGIYVSLGALAIELARAQGQDPEQLSRIANLLHRS